MFKALCFALLLIANVAFGQTHEAICLLTTFSDICDATIGCAWDHTATNLGCLEQDHYTTGTDIGGCGSANAGLALTNAGTGYACIADTTTGSNWFIYQTDYSGGVGSYPDSCSLSDFVDGICSTNCLFLARNETDDEGGCFDDYTSSWNSYADAALCGNRSIGGCRAFINCNYAKGLCYPDESCYYLYVNGNPCNSGSGNPCKYDSAMDLCTADTLLADEKTCLLLTSEQTCTANEKCEWVPPGTFTYTTNANYTASGKVPPNVLWDGTFLGYCSTKGNGASALGISSFTIAALFVALLVFL